MINQINWIMNRSIRDYRFALTNFNINPIGMNLDNNKDIKCWSIKKSNELTFTIKLLNELLPTKDL